MTLNISVSSLLSFAIALMSPTASVGQDVRPVTSEEFYKNSPDVRMYQQQFQTNSSGSMRPMATTTQPSVGPGDHFVAYLYTGDQSFGVGDVVRPKLVFANSTDQYASKGVNIYGRITTPGPSGQFDSNGTVMYIQVDNGSYGYFRGGFAGNETVLLYSLPITPLMNVGEYVLDFSIVDTQSGTLIQQEFARFFVNRTGPNGKGIYTLDGVASSRESGTSTSLVSLQGNFPANGTVNVLYGIPGFSWSQGSMQVDATGHLITLTTSPIAQPGYVGPVQSQDVIIHFPQIRESVTLHNAFTVQAPAATTALPSVQ